MKVTLVALAVILVSASLIMSVSGASWHTVESWTTNVNVQTNPYFYVVHGPFTEDGLAYNGLIVVTVSFVDQGPLTFTVSNGATYSFSSQHQARTLYWNLTTDYNQTRQIVFGSDYSDEVYLYVARTLTETILGYEVSISDMIGLTNATCEIDKNVLGINQVIERQKFDPMNIMNFYLLIYSDYTLKVIADQGTFIWTLATDGDTTQSYAITKDMLVQINSVNNASASAIRWNSTCATVFFNDPSHLTTTVTTNIYIKNMTGQYLFFTQTDAGYTQGFTINTLDPNTNYLARTVTAEGSWTNSLLMPVVTTTIWGPSFDVFGDWSLYARNGLGMFIVMAIISVGSWKDSEWFVGAGIVIAAFLVSMGFMTVPWTGISIALLVVILMYIDRGKKELPYS